MTETKKVNEKLVGGIIDTIESSCDMMEIDIIYRHLEHRLYEASGMADSFDDMMTSNYGGTD